MKIPYPESDTGNMILRKGTEQEPIDCMRVMLQKTRQCPITKISFAQDVVTLVSEMKDYDRERAVIIHLDTKNNVIGIENISTGSINQSIVHPREAVKGALLNSATNVIFVHNHPSGDPEPSREDIEISNNLKKAFDLVAINMLDSIIIGNKGYYSFNENRMLTKSKTGGNIMENSEQINDTPDDDTACSVALEAARQVLQSHCGKSGVEVAEVEIVYGENVTPLSKHIKQEIKAIHALAIANDPSASRRAENTIKQIDSGITAGIINHDQAKTLKDAVKKALQKVPYMEISKLIYKQTDELISQARQLIQEVDRDERTSLEKQLQYYVDNEDYQGIIKLIAYLKK